jgi:hypothetical protein
MREFFKERFSKPSEDGGEVAIVTKNHEGETVALDMKDVRQRCQEMYSQINGEGEPISRIDLTAEQINQIREKVEMRGFDTLLWVGGRDKTPGIKDVIEKLMDGPKKAPPEFFGNVDGENAARLEEERPGGPYLVLTRSTGAEYWTEGKVPKEIDDGLVRVDEKGLTLREYLMVEHLNSKNKKQRPKGAASPRIVGEYLLGSRLPSGEVIAVSKDHTGDISISSAKPDTQHPDYGAKGAVIIPLENKPEQPG